MKETIKICIGTEPRTEIPKKVLQYSIKKHSNAEIQFFDLNGSDYFDRGQLGEGTGFSLLRWSIPEKFNYTGKAIYLDADQLVLSDISELWRYDKIEEQKDACVWCKKGTKPDEFETSVMLINCEKALKKLKSISEINKYLETDIDRAHYREIMKLKYGKKFVANLSPWWNVMDRSCKYTTIKDFGDSRVKLLHYTDVVNQPWYNPDHKFSKIWGKYFKEAFINNIISKDEIINATANFNKDNKNRPTGLHPSWLEHIGV